MKSIELRKDYNSCSLKLKDLFLGTSAKILSFEEKKSARNIYKKFSLSTRCLSAKCRIKASLSETPIRYKVVF